MKVYNLGDKSFDTDLSSCKHEYPLCSFVYTGMRMVLFCAHNWIFYVNKIT